MKVLAVVPAAGRSTRMGNPKPLMDARGRSFLARVVAALREGGAADVVVGVREEKGPVAVEALGAGARILVPADVEDGPIATVRAAIRSVGGEGRGGGPVSRVDGIVLHPVDHPLVAPETIHALLAAAGDARASRRADPEAPDARKALDATDAEGAANPTALPGATIVVPVVEGRSGHPVFLSRELFPELLEPGLPEGARTVLDRHRDEVVEVPVEDRGVLADLNTLADYRRHFPDSYRKRFQKW